MIFFFDTETTGLPPRRVSPSDTDKWSECRIVQIAWQIHDLDTHALLKKQEFIIRPDGFTIPDAAANIHGITTTIAQEHGVPFSDVMAVLATDLESITTAVAHNMEFDDRVLLSELFRYNLSDITNQWNHIPKKCTMRMGTLSGQKWPKLAELYARLFDTPHDPSLTLHRADADVHLCAECYFRLLNKLNPSYD